MNERLKRSIALIAYCTGCTLIGNHLGWQVGLGIGIAGYSMAYLVLASIVDQR